ncbi:hypothetical protein Tco_1455442, partial [Tanacetum coccineum]
MVNGERQIQALIDKKKVIITETSIRSDLYLEDAGGTDCLPTATIFEELARMGYEKPSQKLTFYKAFFSPQWKFLIHTITQCRSAKSTAWNEFSSIMASLIICLATSQKLNLSKYIFDAMVKHLDGGVKFLMRKQRKDTTVTQEETQQDDNVPIPSNDPPLSEKAKDAQANKIDGLKKRVQNLGNYEDASKQGRSIKDIDKDADVSLVDDTQGRSDDAEMFDMNDLHGDEVAVDMPVSEKQEQSAKEREVNISVEDSAAPTTIEEITLAQTLIQIKVAKPKVVTTAATITTITRPKARGVVVQEPSKFRTPQESQPSMIKDKGKAIMIEPEVPLKRKDQVVFDKDLARNLQAQLEAELIEEKRLARKKEEEANIALIELWDNTHVMMEANFELAQRLQAEEQGEITIEERSRLYKHNQLKSKSYEEIQKLFDNEMRRVNTFIPMDSEVVKSKKETEESSKGIEDELESDKSKKAESSEEKAKGDRKKILGKKRAGKEQQQESSKRQRIEDDKEADEHEKV